MEKIYRKVLTIARAHVFENEKYAEIISFCKYKLDNKIYTRNEITDVFPSGKEYKTRVFITETETKNFAEYQQKQAENKTITKTNTLFL